jgi:hypothetical protein
LPFFAPKSQKDKEKHTFLPFKALFYMLKIDINQDCARKQ